MLRNAHTRTGSSLLSLLCVIATDGTVSLFRPRYFDGQPQSRPTVVFCPAVFFFAVAFRRAPRLFNFLHMHDKDGEMLSAPMTAMEFGTWPMIPRSFNLIVYANVCFFHSFFFVCKQLFSPFKKSTFCLVLFM